MRTSRKNGSTSCPSMPTISRKHWIPPGGLLAGFLAHGASWLLLLALAARGSFGVDTAALAWVHLVALGWLSTIALSILIHVIPAFTDVQWRGERVARSAIAVYGSGVAALVAAFWYGAMWALPWAATLVFAGIAAYAVPAGRTLVAAFSQPRIEAAIGRALCITLALFAVAAALGVALAWALAGRLPAGLLSPGPPIHASLALVGWLTVIVMGVSARTIRPITGARSRWRSAHVAAAACEIAGMSGLVAGFACGAAALALAGAAVACAGALVYAADIVDIVRRATARHRPPQAFVLAAVCWLLAGGALGLGALGGAATGAAAIFVLLVGWLGQMVNGHLYHIGIRLVATMARGDEDETRPGELLTAPLTWVSFALFQTAVGAGACAILVREARVLEAAAACGVVGWSAMLANVLRARRRARRDEAPQDARLTISLLRETR